MVTNPEEEVETRRRREKEELVRSYIERSWKGSVRGCREVESPESTNRSRGSNSIRTFILDLVRNGNVFYLPYGERP